MQRDAFLSGVVEGFYGPPWSPDQRLRLFDWLQTWSLNTYFYAPKDDLKHRALWREDYHHGELNQLQQLILAARQRGLLFIYGLSPGLDVVYSRTADCERILGRFQQLLSVGCDHFALLFDDLPGALHAEDQKQFGSLARAQIALANKAWAWLHDRRPSARFLFCPTPYCDRMALRQLGGSGYLECLGAGLDPAIDLLWTGPEIVSREISVASIRALHHRIRRPPVIWDNLHANDYDGRRLFCGPYAGRPRELLTEVRGILSNPNTEFPVNYIPLRTLAEFVAGTGDWDPRSAYLRAMQHWLAEHTTVRNPVTLQDLVLLGDAYYLPHETGPEARHLTDLLKWLVHTPPTIWGEAYPRFQALNQRVQSLFEQLTELKQRDLFYAWSRRVWELKEELQLFDAWLTAKHAQPDSPAGYPSDSHLPGTYRGGLVACLQAQLIMDDSGRFHAAASTHPDTGAPCPL